jgi:hypothetical protein
VTVEQHETAAPGCSASMRPSSGAHGEVTTGVPALPVDEVPLRQPAGAPRDILLTHKPRLQSDHTAPACTGTGGDRQRPPALVGAIQRRHAVSLQRTGR